MYDLVFPFCVAGGPALFGLTRTGFSGLVEAGVEIRSTRCAVLAGAYRLEPTTANGDMPVPRRISVPGPSIHGAGRL